MDWFYYRSTLFLGSSSIHLSKRQENLIEYIVSLINESNCSLSMWYTGNGFTPCTTTLKHFRSWILLNCSPRDISNFKWNKITTYLLMLKYHNVLKENKLTSIRITLPFNTNLVSIGEMKETSQHWLVYNKMDLEW